MAQLINAVNQNTLVTANASKRDRDQFPFITGPDDLKPKPKKPRSVADAMAMFNATGDVPSW